MTANLLTLSQLLVGLYQHGCYSSSQWLWIVNISLPEFQWNCFIVDFFLL